MKFKNVTIYYNEENEFEKAKFETEDLSFDVDDKDKFNDIIKKFAGQEKLTIFELLENDKLVKKVTKVVETKKEDELSDEELDEIVFGVEKKKKKGFVKKLVIYGSIITVLGVGIHHSIKHDLFGKRTKELNSNKKVESTVTNNNKVVNNSNFTIVDSGEDSKGEYGEVMEEVILRDGSNSQVIYSLSEDKRVDLTEKEILEVLNDTKRIANSSMFEISQFINGKDLTGEAYYYNFENNFPVGSYDYKVVKLFSDMRNEILKMAYKSNNAKKCKSKVSDFYDLFMEVVIQGSKSSYGDLKLDFDDLSDMAQVTILEMGSAMLTVDINYKHENSKGSYTKKELLEEALEMLEEDLIPDLVDKGRSR